MASPLPTAPHPMPNGPCIAILDGFRLDGPITNPYVEDRRPHRADQCPFVMFDSNWHGMAWLCVVRFATYQIKHRGTALPMRQCAIISLISSPHAYPHLHPASSHPYHSPGCKKLSPR